MGENEEFDSDFNTEDVPISEEFWNYMENYWHNNREFPESIESSLNKKADLIGGKVPASQLPSYVDDVLEFDTFENLPNPGEKGKIYLVTNNSTQFRWSGSEYIQLNSDEFLMTTNTNQHIVGRKEYITNGGNTWDKNSLMTFGQNGSKAGMTFYSEGMDIGQINFDGYFNLKDANDNTFKHIKGNGFIKDGSNDDYFLTGGGGHLDKNTKEDSYFHSRRNFTEGTLIKTTVDYSVDYGHQFLLEMKGNMYSGNLPLEMKVQGYIYYGKIISERGYSTYSALKVITALNLEGKLCFWFPNLGYWQGFSVKLTTGYGGSENGINRVTDIENLPDPQGTKRVEIYIDTLATQEWVNGKPFNSITYNDINNWNTKRFNKTPIDFITSSFDANTVDESGFYRIGHGTTNTGGYSGSNDGARALLHFETEGVYSASQIQTERYTGNILSRTRNDGGWTQWVRHWGTNDFSQSDISNWNHLAVNAATQTWTSSNFFSKTGGTIDGKVKINPGIGVTGNNAIIGNGDSASFLLSGDSGLWGTAIGHNSSTGDLWVQPQRFDGGSNLYNINLAPLGGNVTVNNQTVATQSWVESQDYATYESVEESINKITSEHINPDYPILAKNKFNIIIITEEFAREYLEFDSKLIPERNITVINIAPFDVEVYRDGNAIDRIHSRETAEYYITSNEKLIKKGIYRDASVLN